MAAAKRALRSEARQRRRETPPKVRQARDIARLRHLLPQVPNDAVVALYLSRGDEPSTLEAAAVLWRRGQRILVPALTDTPGAARRDPTWAWYRGPSDLRPGYLGIPEPTGPALPAATLHEADLVLVSGLAGGRDGSRLGAGAGWFDRALVHTRPGARVLLVVDEQDVFDTLPHAEHDHRVDALVTEVGTIHVADTGTTVELVAAGEQHAAGEQRSVEHCANT
ncbi:5-formyltetrahydrofolate cyclo-ligase [Propionibacteriaceae bacterium Y1923]|uniref:5-formyltetrahydrofolate cyclo-ligase n=1 Tax=Aestuariimicrobium sp. Y1814 TaxID=3418742 RepID=UPI003C161419